MSAPDFTPEQLSRLERIESTKHAPEALVERIAVAMWKADSQLRGYQGMADDVLDIVTGRRTYEDQA